MNVATRLLYPVARLVPKDTTLHPGFREDIFVVIDFGGRRARGEVSLTVPICPSLLTIFKFTFTEIGVAMVDGFNLARSPGGDDFDDRKTCHHYINASRLKTKTRAF